MLNEQVQAVSPKSIVTALRAQAEKDEAFTAVLKKFSERQRSRANQGS